jgi:cytochrome b pre-mRNA-processing protein 3
VIFARIFGRSSPAETAASELYRAAVTKARDPIFYSDLGVPDTVNGRFDMVVIHVMLLFRQLRNAGDAGPSISAELLKLMFADMDQSLREMGVGDMSVGKHVKKMAKAFYGRAEAYEAGLDGNPELLHQALVENLYRHTAPPADALNALSAYMKRMDSHLATQVTEIGAGRANFDLAVK